MALRSNHYDAAFEAYLRQERRPYVAVDEAHRALVAESSLKSLDFIVYSVRGRNLLIDVKGRKFPSGSSSGGNRWENWATEDDVNSLLAWEHLFGRDFRSLLVFAYDLVDGEDPAAPTGVWTFRQRSYAFYGVWVDEYAGVMRSRSPSWETVSLPLAEFARLRQPIDELL